MIGTNTENMIQPDGHIAGLDLRSSEMLIVRNYVNHGFPIPIVVDRNLAMDASSTLQLVFDADAWDSTFSFAPGIPVTLGGTLQLAFAAGVDPADQLGRAIDLFDWSGVTPTGTFNVSSPYTWNLSNLYTTGQVTLSAVPGVVPGDFNGNGVVDAADYVVWRKTDGTPGGYNTWRANFGRPAASSSAAAVPETSSIVLLLVVLSGASFFTRRAARSARKEGSV
jgi:hypothetical protein